MVQFFKNWTLPIAMLAGILGYFVFVSIPMLAPTKPFVNQLIGVLQPLLIFAMLFLSFCKVNPHELRLRPLHLWLLLVQIGAFCLLGLLLYLFPHSPYRVIDHCTVLRAIRATLGTSHAAPAEPWAGCPCHLGGWTRALTRPQQRAGADASASDGSSGSSRGGRRWRRGW